VRRIRAGDEAAFEQLFHAYYRVLCTFAFGYLRSPEAAEDLVHDVLLWIWERREQWEVHEELRSYLYRAVRNRVLNTLKRERLVARWQDMAAVDGSMAGIGMAPAHADADVRSRELATAFDAAVERLPARQRQAFLLRWQHRLPYAEIAVVMGVSEKTVESTLTRTLKKLREELAAFF
jgi:RNA polymerase sigma-70 factor (ECF subfamily)